MKNRIKLTGIMLKALLARALIVPCIIALALAAGCNQKKPAEQSANAATEAQTAEAEIIHDPNFAIYGRWAYDLDLSSYDMFDAYITLNTDDTVVARLGKSSTPYSGVMNQTDTHIIVHSIESSDPYTADQWILTYNPETGLLRLDGWTSGGGVAFFRNQARFNEASLDGGNSELLFELKTPRMNGQEIVNLQNRLLSLGFSELGEADGYYGPLAEGVIKNIQAFSGFEADGKVNRNLRDYIFDDRNISFLGNVSAVLAYNPASLVKSRDFLYTDIPYDAHEEAFVYSSPDKKAKILEYYSGNPNTQTSMTCYFISDSNYFIKYSFTQPDFETGGTVTTENIYAVNNNNLNEITNGVMNPIVKDIIEPITKILEMFNEQ